MKKLRVSATPEVQAIAVSRTPGGATVLVDFGGDTKVHVSLIPPRPQSQTAVHDKAVVEVVMEIAPFSYKYEIDEDLRDSRVSEIQSLIQESLAASVELSAYPKTVLTFRVVILETPAFSVGSLLPAALLGATLALEKAEIAVVGRAMALQVGESGVIGFDLHSGKILLMHTSTLPDVSSVLSELKTLEADLTARGLFKQ